MAASLLRTNIPVPARSTPPEVMLDAVCLFAPTPHSNHHYMGSIPSFILSLNPPLCSTECILDQALTSLLAGFQPISLHPQAASPAGHSMHVSGSLFPVTESILHALQAFTTAGEQVVTSPGSRLCHITERSWERTASSTKASHSVTRKLPLKQHTTGHIGSFKPYLFFHTSLPNPSPVRGSHSHWQH